MVASQGWKAAAIVGGLIGVVAMARRARFWKIRSLVHEAPGAGDQPADDPIECRGGGDNKRGRPGGQHPDGDHLCQRCESFEWSDVGWATVAPASEGDRSDS